MTIPLQFVGVQAGFGDLPPIELYTLLAPVGVHPTGSTVSRQTLERHGLEVLTNEVAEARREWPGRDAA